MDQNRHQNPQRETQPQSERRDERRSGQGDPTHSEREPQQPARPPEERERAGGISNRPLDEEEREQDELPERGSSR